MPSHSKHAAPYVFKVGFVSCAPEWPVESPEATEIGHESFLKSTNLGVNVNSVAENTFLAFLLSFP